MSERRWPHRLDATPPRVPPTPACTARRRLPDSAAWVVPVFDDLTTPCQTAPPLLHALATSPFEGSVGDTATLLIEGRVVVATGVGPRVQVDADVLRTASTAAAREARTARHLATSLLSAGGKGLHRPAAAQAVVEGTLLGRSATPSYGAERNTVDLESVTVLDRRPGSLKRAIDRGVVIAQAVHLARGWVSAPPGQATPQLIAEWAANLGGRGGLEVEVWDEQRVAHERLGGVIAVSAGSAEPPRVVRMTYEPPRHHRSVALVGKGISFDSGGLSIKTAAGMETMKVDVAGAAAVIAAMSVLPVLRPSVRVIAYAMCAENMPSGTATRPGDVISIRGGRTVEVLDTDCEGRLVLADGLSLAVEDGVDEIVDVATLTGACITAFGVELGGLFASSQSMANQVLAAARRAGEGLWQLPLADRYRRHIESDVADIKNVGLMDGTAAAITAALFLAEFVGDKPWAHLDVAGPVIASVSAGGEGEAGFTVRTLIELLAPTSH